MKYGTQKYGTFKYGVSIATGSGSIAPSGALAILKVYLRDVGNGIVTISQNLSKSIYKWIGSATMSITGNVSKSIGKKAGLGIVTISGHAAKTLFISAGGAILNSIANISKQISKSAGQSSISIQSTMNKLSYYFLVTLDNILQPLGIQVIGDSRKDLFPGLKEYTDSVPGKHGEVYFGSNLKSKLLELHVISEEGLTPEQKETQKRFYAKYLDATKGEKRLVFEDELGKTYKVKYAGKIDITPYPTSFEFTIPFKMANPYITSNSDNTQSGNGTLTNAGNVETPLIISASGPLTNPSMIIGVNTLLYTGTISTGQTLVIDTENMTVELDGLNVIQNYTGEFPMLQSGNTSVTASNQVTFTWRDRWC